MKKLIAMLLCVSGCISAYALPFANPAEPSLFTRNTCRECCPNEVMYNSYEELGAFGIVSFRIGYYGDFVFDRRLKNKVPSIVHKTELFTNAGFLAVNFCNRLDLFTTLGVSRICMDGFSTSFRSRIAFPSFRTVAIKSDAEFSWSVGARATLWEWCCFGIGAEGQYFRTSPSINSVTDKIVLLDYPKDVLMKYHEWQAGLGAYYRLELKGSFLSAAVPYVGIKWSGLHLDMQNAIVTSNVSAISSLTLIDHESSRHFGYSIGVTTVFCNRFGLTVEGRFRDERALFVNGEVRF